MKKITLLLALVLFNITYAQTIIAYDSFEEETISKVNEIGYTADTFHLTSNDYFSRISTAEIVNPTAAEGFDIASTTLSNIHDDNGGESYFLGGEDINNSNGAREDYVGLITFNNVNVTGYTDLSIKIALAVGQDVFEVANDYLEIYYAFDDDITAHPSTSTGFTQGSYTQLAYFTGNGTPDDLALDGGTTSVVSAGSFSDFSFNIAETGDNLSIRIRMRTTSGNEEIFIDNLRIITDNVTLSNTLLETAKASVKSNGTSFVSTDASLAIEVYNTLGQQVSNKSLAHGVYIIKVTNAKGQVATLKKVL